MLRISDFFVGGIAPPGAAFFFLAVSARHPLLYAIDANGIALKAGETGSGFSGAAPSYWIDLRRRALTDVELSHWRCQPALLIRTQRNPRSYVVPLERHDVEPVREFLLAFQP